MTQLRRAGCLVAFGIVAVSLPAGAQEPGARIQRVEVVVAAASGSWVSANLAAAPGDLLLVRAAGRVEVAPEGLEPAAPRSSLRTFAVSADGIGGMRNADGTLELAVNTGPAAAVGAHDFLVVRDSGGVRLRVLASHPELSSGAFRVEILRIPARMLPGPPAGSLRTRS